MILVLDYRERELRRLAVGGAIEYLMRVRKGKPNPKVMDDRLGLGFVHSALEFMRCNPKEADYGYRRG